MPAFERHADVTWTGSLKEGKGQATAGTSAFSLPVSFPRRVEQPDGWTSPEELIAAAHAACYAMALSATLGRKNASASHLQVRATVTGLFENGIKIQSSRLDVTAEGLQGVSAGDFPAIAREAEAGCPVSNALRGSLKIEVNAKVV
jgi:osmotically inducible protein OsmC